MFWLNLSTSCIQMCCRQSATNDMLTMFYCMLMNYLTCNACVAISWASGIALSLQRVLSRFDGMLNFTYFEDLIICIQIYDLSSFRPCNLHFVLKHWGQDCKNGHNAVNYIFKFISWMKMLKFRLKFNCTLLTGALSFCPLLLMYVF